MIKRFILALVTATAFFAGSLTQALAENGEDLLRLVDEIRAPANNFQFHVKVSTGSKSTLTMQVNVKDQSKGLVRYLTPKKNKGRSILFVGRNMWVYIPGSRRPLRISPQQQVLGGVSSADIARTVYSADYKVMSVNADSSREKTLSLKAKSKAAAYGRIALVVSAKDTRPLRAKFFSANGERLLKTAYFEGYKAVLGRQRPTKLRIVDHLAGNATTTMTYSKYQLKDTPASWFQPSNLHRL
ncbi:outer membrane lipoprotein-sorting protein [Pseudovibrio ascidiaceicola]|jgi:outer membrane lipoprotein-sorting protein|uniref:outer membrane lipoprotein-sorting protein n=1 Tax=Pseudovibrio ascidiaceicola TaxID=285279 RepID=UPI000D6996E0|nr:outer membrane lipoprotein-sorting protein [Pseudovibrio ascidiaceicola]